jgi:S1-C subfamily serine protease
MRLDLKAIDLGPIAVCAVNDARLYQTSYVANGAVALQIASKTRGLLGSLTRNILGVSETLAIGEVVLDPTSKFFNLATTSGILTATGRAIEADGAALPVWRLTRALATAA